VVVEPWGREGSLRINEKGRVRRGTGRKGKNQGVLTKLSFGVEGGRPES